MSGQLQPRKISSRARRALARASTIASGGKFVSSKMRSRHPAKPITLRLVERETVPKAPA